MDHGDVLAELAGLLAECSAGAGGLALVSGGLASGKTELLQRFQRHAAAAGALLLTATGAPAERPLQAGVIDQLFDGAGLPPEIADRVSHLITPIAATVDDSGADVQGIRPSYVRPVHELCQILIELSRERPVVLCVDEKTQVQALDRTVPILPMQEGRIERRSHDYYRHGTSTLFAALDIATGQVTAALKPRHRHQEWLAFLKLIKSQVPADRLQCMAVALAGDFPDLTALEVKNIILETATRYPQEVLIPGGEGARRAFGELSVTGGVVNAYEAVRRAMAY